jgi:hypothetical protein
MRHGRSGRAAWGLAAAFLAAALLAQQEEAPLGVNHADCTLFTERGAEMRRAHPAYEGRRTWERSALTAEVTALLAAPRAVPGGSRTDIFQQLDGMGLIDAHLFRAMMEAGVSPAAPAGDYEFLRRVSLDLTGRIPAPERVQFFAANPQPDKRARLIEELLASPEWADKWTMFFGDLFRNTARTTQVVRYSEGRDAFYKWIQDSLRANKPYNLMVRELIASSGENSWEDGELNWLVGGFVTGSPRGNHDIFDQQAANVAETFLGISHFNCILCHDGRRRMEELSVWGTRATRLDAWGLAAFFAKTSMTRQVVSPQPLRYYWRIADNPRSPDYPLNTTTGNRPARSPIGTISSVRPQYPWSGEQPAPNENYRDALARILTSDLQFSRAIVNYLWKEFFGRGLVEPVNQFDPLRLDPNNPPPPPLNDLARQFQQNNFDLKWLMRSIAGSQAYQLSSRYDGAWKPEYEKYFARKFVRRLWGEEILDAAVQISNLPNRMNVPTLGPLNWAMQLPDPATPGGGTGSFLDSFFRGNRDTEFRRPDGSVPQTLNLMNDPLIVNRTKATGTGASASFARQLLNRHPQAGQNSALIGEMFLTVLSRPPSPDENAAALAELARASSTSARQQAVENLLWALFNKVDFVFNY